MATAKKDTIYIEADDEITAVIDKVVNAKSEIVAVVLPKRAVVFQSVVNMRLLKKSASDANKRVVLISSDPAIEPIAAVSLMHIAPSLTSKPIIPKREHAKSDSTISSKELEDNELDSDNDSDEDNKDEHDNDTIEIDNTSADKKVEAITLADKAKDKNKKKFKIPDFNSFKLRVALMILACVLLVAGWFIGFVVMPKATVTIDTNTSSQTVNMEFKVLTSATQLDNENAVLPATIAELTKNDSVTVDATGEKDKGEKATGTVTLTNCKPGATGVSVPAGTTFTSGNLSFVTTESIDLGPAVIIGTCRSADFPSFGAVGDVAIQASQPGTDYNISARSLTSNISGVSAYVSDMSGGTTNKVKVVSADDLNKAKEQLKGSATSDAIDELKQKLADQNLQGLVETLDSSEPKITTSIAVDAEADKLTVNQAITYKMLGISSNDLSNLLDFELQKILKDQGDKNVRNNGLASASYTLVKKDAVDNQTLALQTVATLGPTFDEVALKKEIIGKKRGDIERMLESKDGVRSANVEYSPSWVTTTPKSEKKIIIIINEVEN